MKVRPLAFRLPSDIYDSTDAERSARIRDAFQVYLNHEDSDFPFEYLANEGCVVDRDKDIDVALTSMCEGRRMLTVAMSLTYHCKVADSDERRPEIGYADIQFQMNLETGEVGLVSRQESHLLR